MRLCQRLLGLFPSPFALVVVGHVVLSTHIGPDVLLWVEVVVVGVRHRCSVGGGDIRTLFHHRRVVVMGASWWVVALQNMLGIYIKTEKKEHTNA